MSPTAIFSCLFFLGKEALYREAFYNLKKAEKIAFEYDQFNVLEIVYDEMVKLSVHLEVDIDTIIDKRKKNLKKIEILRANSEVLGMVTQQLMKRNYSRSNKSHSVIETLETVKERLEEHKDIFHSSSGKIMILKTVVSILIQKSAYRELAEYARETFQDFAAHKLFNKDNHSTRLMLRIWRINSLQKLLELEEAKKEIDALYQDLQMYQKQNFNELAFHYYSPNVYNHKLTGDLDGAADALKMALKHNEVLKNEIQELYLLISLSDQYFQSGIICQGYRYLEKNHSP